MKSLVRKSIGAYGMIDFVGPAIIPGAKKRTGIQTGVDCPMISKWEKTPSICTIILVESSGRICPV